MKPLPREFYARDPVTVAKDLLGKTIIHETPDGKVMAKIVETEAYLGKEDEASHGYRRTKRSEIFWGPPGISYVFVNYGVHHCFNTITCPENVPGAVLIRAVEPVEGLELMQKRRGNSELEGLTNGPGKLSQALGITMKHNGEDLIDGGLYIAEGTKPKEIRVSKRIGITRSSDLPLRFFIKNNPFVSGTKSFNAKSQVL